MSRKLCDVSDKFYAFVRCDSSVSICNELINYFDYCFDFTSNEKFIQNLILKSDPILYLSFLKTYYLFFFNKHIFLFFF